MKETQFFMPSVKVYLWQMGDWKDGRLEITLSNGTKVLGWQVFKWVGNERTPKSLSGELSEGKLTLMRPPREDWEGCVTVFLLPLALEDEVC